MAIGSILRRLVIGVSRLDAKSAAVCFGARRTGPQQYSQRWVLLLSDATAAVNIEQRGIAAVRPTPVFPCLFSVLYSGGVGGSGRGERSLTGATPLAEWSWRQVEVLGLDGYRQASIRRMRAKAS